jgi:hypothetical protein
MGIEPITYRLRIKPSVDGATMVGLYAVVRGVPDFFGRFSGAELLARGES